MFASEEAIDDVLWGFGDHQGTVRDVASYDDSTNDTTVENHITYDAFGKILIETNSSIEFKHTFTGRIYDEDVELYYYRARWYNANVGRFISEDPIRFEAGDANLTRYVGNSSVNLIDPSGLAPGEFTPTWHHLLPKADSILNFFKDSPDILEFINDPDNGWYMLWKDHETLHGKWNSDWMNWLKNRQYESMISPSLDEVKKQIEIMKKQYNLVDSKGKPLTGVPVKDIDGMPYDVWDTDPETRKKWREKNNTKFDRDKLFDQHNKEQKRLHDEYLKNKSNKNKNKVKKPKNSKVKGKTPKGKRGLGPGGKASIFITIVCFGSDLLAGEGFGGATSNLVEGLIEGLDPFEPTSMGGGMRQRIPESPFEPMQPIPFIPRPELQPFTVDTSKLIENGKLPELDISRDRDVSRYLD